MNPPWNIQRTGHAWGGEVEDRWALTPEKIELIEGRLFWCEEDRLNMLGLLLENLGADAAVRFGDPDVWRAAVKSLP